GLAADSHDGTYVAEVLEFYPREELLMTSVPDLAQVAAGVLQLRERRQTRLFLRRDVYGRYISCLIYLPRDRYTTDVRLKAQEILQRGLAGSQVDYSVQVGESPVARLHIVLRAEQGQPLSDMNRAELERAVAAAARSWDDDLAVEVPRSCGEQGGRALLAMVGDAIPETYKTDVPPSAACADLAKIMQLRETGEDVAFELWESQDYIGGVPLEDGGGKARVWRLSIYRTGSPITLTDVLPRLQHMGVDIVDEHPYVFPAAEPFWIYDFGLRRSAPESSRGAPDTRIDLVRDNVEGALGALWRGTIEDDGFNALVLDAHLNWSQAAMLRAYAKYLRQAGTAFSQDYIEQVLRFNPTVTRLLVRLFESRFDPAHQGGEIERSEAIAEEIRGELDEVASLDEDRILRTYWELIGATLRTNYFAGAFIQVPYLVVKLDAARVPDLPAPRPKFELFVYSPRFEGVHLRFADVARGALRWSDRREDFRTEVLGLVKAQMVKNAVIVPTGSKGGFVPKQLPDPAADRDAWLAEGVACYRTFISCLLDVTDNYLIAADGTQTIEPPPQTRRFDPDDPYLVVAADKGTATFSDIANGIADDYGYWLGDAFASGGSVGYDHKAMGITARGAWESVKYHFRELGVDIQRQDFTAVGIGDMSGDVFGNGMLLSEHIRLVAAFDHRHVFLDPNPDAASSFAERRRMFELPRSTWADYDTSLISDGGGVYPRVLKSIPITPQVAAALGLPSGTVKLTPTELIHAILLAPVDLLWNGGIGTYVKASTEPQFAAGDKANDGLRANGDALRAKVVGEGGNLGFTQLGRVEYARTGGRINTDAIDNSAGVDTSDHEVNLKILLNQSVASGAIDRDERNALLASVTDDVAAHVLRDNYEQNVLLGMARKLDPTLVSVHLRFMQALEAGGELDRALEFLPTDKEIAQREAEGRGLCSPENSVLVAYSKISLTRHIEASTLPDEPWFHRALAGYFPPAIAARFADDLARHPLHREIITTVVVNDMINRSGTTFVHRAIEETSSDVAEITRAYSVVREAFGLESLWGEIEALDNQVPIDAQHAGYQEIRRLIDRATRWLVDVRFPISDVAAEIERFAPTLQQLGPRITELVRGAELTDIHGESARLVGLGLPDDLAMRLAELLSTFLLLDVVEIANASEHSAGEIAELHFALSDQFYVDEMLTGITHLPRDDRWTTLARAAVRHDVYAALSAITTAVLRSTDDSASADQRMADWTAANIERVERARTTVRAALDREVVDLATLSVALRVMRGLPS
ncbi:MAG: NAD-glutamate dehydrogenase, partial [Jatrophihabitantaceae bacterium]